MGGKRCINEEERLERRRANCRKYYHAKRKKFGAPPSTQELKDRHRKSSLKYYYTNKETCMANQLRWRQENPERVKQLSQRAYQKRKYGRNIIFIKKSSIDKS